VSVCPGRLFFFFFFFFFFFLCSRTLVARSIRPVKKSGDRLPFKRKPVPEVKYGPNRLIWMNDDEANRQEAERLDYASNLIVTSTYTLLTFFPLNMFEQFRKVANLYFLIIVILQLIPTISPVQPYGSMAALVFVIGFGKKKKMLLSFFTKGKKKCVCDSCCC
jgi:hypothetical protein